MVLINVTSLYGKTSAMDTVDGSSTGIAMCQIAFLLRDAESLLMARLGSQGHVAGTSALPPAPDVTGIPWERLNLIQSGPYPANPQ